MIKNKYNIAVIEFLLISYIFKRQGNYVYIPKKTFFILNMFIYKWFYKNEKKKNFKISWLFKCIKQ